jgi:SAM-dependent methyltransferase
MTPSPRDIAHSGPNADQIEYWNETSGPKWVALADDLDRMIAPLGLRAMDAAAIAAGERVLDVGCGCGQTSLELVRRVGANGRVLGVDVSAPMLESARQRASQRKGGRLEFMLADAQTAALERAAFDLLFSRFGVMFFADPVAAFSNLRRALVSGGRLAFVCWQPLQANPWMLVPLGAAAKHIPLPPPPPPGAPGPFAFGDAERVARILAQAGFAQVELEACEMPIRVGSGDLDSAVRFLLEGAGPMSAALKDATGEVREKVAASVRAALEPFQRPGGVELPSATWIATARNP